VTTAGRQSYITFSRWFTHSLLIDYDFLHRNKRALGGEQLRVSSAGFDGPNKRHIQEGSSTHYPYTELTI